MKPKPETDRVRLGRLTPADRYWIHLLSPEQRRDALVQAAQKLHQESTQDHTGMTPDAIPPEQMPTEAAEREIMKLGFFSILLDTDPDTGEKDTMMRFLCGGCASKHPDLKGGGPELAQRHEAFMRELEHPTSLCDECGVPIRNY